MGKGLPTTKGATYFTLDPTDARRDSGERSYGPTAGPGGAVQHTASAYMGVPLPPRLTYAPNPGRYTQWWLAWTKGAGAAKLGKECKEYLAAFLGTTVDYLGVVLYLLAVAEDLVLLKVLLGNQVCILH